MHPQYGFELSHWLLTRVAHRPLSFLPVEKFLQQLSFRLFTLKQLTNGEMACQFFDWVSVKLLGRSFPPQGVCATFTKSDSLNWSLH